jgi:hypothetical protein
MLLALIPLSVDAILKEESDMFGAEGSKILPRRQGLISSLQDLIQYSGILVPPSSVVNAANAAASKAAIFKANYTSGVVNSSMVAQTDSSTKASPKAGTYTIHSTKYLVVIILERNKKTR